MFCSHMLTRTGMHACMRTHHWWVLDADSCSYRTVVCCTCVPQVVEFECFTGGGTTYARNARPLQQLNGRALDVI